MTASDAALPVAPSRAAFGFVFITVVLDMLAMGIMVPVLPKLVIAMSHGDIAKAASVTGVFGFTWAAMQFVFAPVVGALSDRYGRRPVILLSNFGLGADYVLMALAPNLVWLFVGRVISGMTSASVPAASAYVADVDAEGAARREIRHARGLLGLGSVVVPGLGGILGQINLRLPSGARGSRASPTPPTAFHLAGVAAPRAPGEGRRGTSPILSARSSSCVRARRSSGSPARRSSTTWRTNRCRASSSCTRTYRYAWNERDVGLALARRRRVLDDRAGGGSRDRP